MTQQTQIDITEPRVATGPEIQVVLGRGTDAQVVHLTYAELDEFHGEVLDVPAMISDESLLTALEGYLQEHGHDGVSLAGKKITRPATGNLLVGPSNEFGND